MTTDAQTAVKKDGPRVPLWRDRRFWSLIVFVAIVVTILHEQIAFLKFEESASFAAADYIDKHLAPATFTAAFDERAEQCDYHWLFFCGARPKQSSCPLDLDSFRDCISGRSNHSWLDPDRYRTLPGETEGAIAMFGNGVLTLAQLPDATWFVIKKAYQEGWLSLLGLLAFVGLNIFVATRFPLITLPVTFPISAVIGSGLFWIVEQLLRLTANGVGALFWCLAAVGLLPTVIVTVLNEITKSREIFNLAHEAREASSLVDDIVHHRK